MSCPLNRNRFVGSGYRKESCSADMETESFKQLDTKYQELLAARNAQDNLLFRPYPAVHSDPAPTIAKKD